MRPGRRHFKRAFDVLLAPHIGEIIRIYGLTPQQCRHITSRCLRWCLAPRRNLRKIIARSTATAETVHRTMIGP